MSNSLDVLTSEDSGLFVELFDASLRINQREQLFSLMQGVFQYLFPHEVLICAYRYQSGEDLNYERFVSTRYFKDEHFTHITDPFSGLLHRIMQAWQKTQRPILLADELEVGEHATFGTPFHERKGSLKSLELKNVAAHGIAAGNGEVMSFFMFGRVDTPLLSERHAYFLELFVPHLHVILMRIAARRFERQPMSFSAFRNKAVKQKSMKSRITMREQEVLRWMQAGKTNQEIGHILGLSPLTIKNHVHNILKKLGVENRSNACHKAAKMGLIA